MSTLNLYKIEDNESISCLQEGCNYKFRNPKNKHQSIMKHYNRYHCEIYKQLKNQTKPYSKPLQPTNNKCIENVKNSFQITEKNNEITSYKDFVDLEKQFVQAECLKNKKSFCFHYLVDGRYFNIKFFKVDKGYEMRFFLSHNILCIMNEILDDFSYIFISFKNAETFEIIEDEFLFLNLD
ncbi:966_t:CDS:1, partial [Cetraspora pellucida]